MVSVPHHTDSFPVILKSRDKPKGIIIFILLDIHFLPDNRLLWKNAW